MFIKAVVAYVGNKIGLKACESKNKRESEPWWKRRIKVPKNGVKKHINILECPQSGEIKRKENIRNLKGSIT